MKKKIINSKSIVSSFRIRSIEMSELAANKLREASAKDAESVFEMLHSSSKGLSDLAAEERISEYGLNEVAYDKAPTWFVQLKSKLGY